MIRNLACCLVLLAVRPSASAESVTIQVDEPAGALAGPVETGDATIRVQGRVISDTEVEEIIFNGQSLGGRDLEVIGMDEEESSFFNHVFPLKVGDNLITIEARDAAGSTGRVEVVVRRLANAAEAAESVTIQIDEPAGALAGPIETGDATIRVQGRAFADTEVEEIIFNGRRLGGRDLEVIGMDEEESSAFSRVFPLKVGDNLITIEARDAAGNAGRVEVVVRRLANAAEAAEAGGEVYALVVGIDDYQDETITDLRFAEKDARAFYELLIEEGVGIVRPENVRYLPSREATYLNISRAIEDHLVNQARSPGDMVILYFAGHGAEGPHVVQGAAYYLVPADAVRTNLLSTAIEKGRLQFLWGAIPAQRKVIITDACHSGGLKGLQALSTSGFEDMGAGKMTLAAARADQRSYELPALGHGIFTHTLLEGLRGRADEEGNNDGLVSLAEVKRFLDTEVPQRAVKVGADQEPVIELGAGAKSVFLSTPGDVALPAWEPPAGGWSTGATGQPVLHFEFEEGSRSPVILVLLREERELVETSSSMQPGVAETGFTGALLKAKPEWRVVDKAGATSLTTEQIEAAIEGEPAYAAAVARALEADFLVVGNATAKESSAAMQRLMKIDAASFQGNLTVKVISAATGDVVSAQVVNAPGAHLEPTTAEQVALQRAGIKLARQAVGDVEAYWLKLRAQRPGGLVRLAGVGSYEAMQEVEDGLRQMAILKGLVWRSFDRTGAVFEFEPAGEVSALVAQLQDRGLGAYRAEVGKMSEREVTITLK
ncbi:caspase domain-containing protein [Candidatus Latescibacterota bacterium]